MTATIRAKSGELVDFITGRPVKDKPEEHVRQSGMTLDQLKCRKIPTILRPATGDNNLLFPRQKLPGGWVRGNRAQIGKRRNGDE